MDSGQYHPPCRGPIQHDIQIPLHFSQIRIEALYPYIEAGENQPPVRLNPWHFEQSPLLPFQLPIICLVILRHPYQSPLQVVGPPVVWALEHARIPFIDPTHTHPTMPAGIDKDPHAPIEIAAHDHRLLAHEIGHKVARLRNLGFMRHV